MLVEIIQGDDLTMAMHEFINQNEGQIFRFSAYRKTYTPYEVQNGFMDELDTTEPELCYITDAIKIGDSEYLMEIQTGYYDEVQDEDGYYQTTFVTGRKVYYKLSDIVLEKYEVDNNHDIT